MRPPSTPECHALGDGRRPLRGRPCRRGQARRHDRGASHQRMPARGGGARGAAEAVRATPGRNRDARSMQQLYAVAIVAAVSAVLFALRVRMGR
jgi:hypothetical protein